MQKCKYLQLCGALVCQMLALLGTNRQFVAPLGANRQSCYYCREWVGAYY